MKRKENLSPIVSRFECGDHTAHSSLAAQFKRIVLIELCCTSIFAFTLAFEIHSSSLIPLPRYSSKRPSTVCVEVALLEACSGRVSNRFSMGVKRLLPAVLCVLHVATREVITVDGLPASFSKDYFNPCIGTNRLNSMQIAKAMAAHTKAFTHCAYLYLNRKFDYRMIPFLARRYCLGVAIFYAYLGDSKNRLPVRLFRNGSALMAFIEPRLHALSGAGREIMCKRLSTDKVCANRVRVYRVLLELAKCFQIALDDILPRYPEEQFLIMQYVVKQFF